MSARAFALAGLLLGCHLLCPASEPAPLPVSPTAAIHSALKSNLDQVRSWLADSDFASAAEATRGLSALAWLSEQQGDAAGWRHQTAALRRACSTLEAAVRRKGADASAKAADACATLLAGLAKEKAGASRAGAPAPFGSTKTWMLLIEGAYVDAKSAESPRDLERQARAIAEEILIVSRLRTDPRWRKLSEDVRTAALRAAESGRTQDLATARKALKAVYHRCEACHQANRP
jgi:hypothetical protein